MATQTITVTNFEQVPGRSDRIHFASMLSYTGFTSISVVTNGDNDLQWNFVGYNSGGSIVVDQYWFNPGYDLDLSGISYMDQVVQWELWIRHSGNGSIDPLAISSAVCTLTQESSGWYVGPDGITNEEFLDDMPFMTEPFPLSIWQCDSRVDNGFAYVPLFPDAVKIDPHPVPQNPYIVIFLITATQSELMASGSNGQAILLPTVCEDTEELSGAWTLNLEHPIDPEGRWKLIQEGNIIRAGGQLFTIKHTEEIWSGNSGRITASCEHIFYQYGDNWIFADPVNVVEFKAKSYKDTIQQVNTQLTDKIIIPGGTVYSYTGEGDTTQFDSLYYVALTSGCNPIEMILGENGVIHAKGGELHRDNFYFSIYPRKENANDHAFDIRIGKNLTGVKRTVDTSTMCTYYRLTDAATGMWNNWGWDTNAHAIPVWRNYLPHHVVRSEVISLPADIDFRFERLCQEGEARFSEICMPIIGYEINLEDVRKNTDFTITADESIRAGDIGMVYDQRLGGALMLEVTSTVYDRITGKCKSFTVGNSQSFVCHNTMSFIRDENGNIIKPDNLGGEIWLSDSEGVFLYDADGVKLIVNEEVQ